MCTSWGAHPIQACNSTVQQMCRNSSCLCRSRTANVSELVPATVQLACMHTNLRTNMRNNSSFEPRRLDALASFCEQRQLTVNLMRIQDPDQENQGFDFCGCDPFFFIGMVVERYAYDCRHLRLVTDM